LRPERKRYCKVSNYKVTVILLPTGEGSYQVFFPHFTSCITLGDSVEEALANAKEALELHLGEPDKDDLESLELSYSPVVTVGEIEVEIPAPATVTAAR